MKLSSFIRDNRGVILQGCEEFAGSVQPNPRSMNKEALRNHLEDIILEIADEIETPESKHEQTDNLKGYAALPRER